MNYVRSQFILSKLSKIHFMNDGLAARINMQYNVLKYKQRDVLFMKFDTLRVGVIGATGYAGLELIRLLLGHPAVELTYVAGNHDVDDLLSNQFAHLAGRTSVRLQKYNFDTCKDLCDVVFVALPAGASGKIGSELWKAGKRVIDLSGDLRIPAELYSTWYGKEPIETEIQQQAVYGLPEWFKKEISSATLISNPGCYPTATLLGLLPVIRNNLHSPGIPIVVDAKSGVSGAGRAPKQNVHFGELAENFYAYKVGKHQHIPEIEYYLDSSLECKVTFTTHLLPVIRGIFTSMYVPLQSEVSESDILDIYQFAYESAPFVQILAPGQIPEIKSVRGSNVCQIGFTLDKRTGMLQIFSAIDNLQKGAAGQAVQNLNVLLDLPETTGINYVPLVP